MRTVRGQTDHVVVVGAGLAGLSAAIRLVASGRRVTLLERAAIPGGRAGLIEDSGYRFDNGPTVLTMPDLLADVFAAVGENLSDWLTLRPLDPLYRAWFADGSTIDVLSDTDAMAAQIESMFGAAEADGYRRFVQFTRRLYDLEMDDFIGRNIDSPLNLLVPNLAKLAAAGGFRRMAPTVAQYLEQPQLQRLFTFQAMYAGMSPQNALALYCVITYMDSVAGVYTVDGGMHAIPTAMASVAQKHGAEVYYDTEVTYVERRGPRATAVHTAAGDRIACDAVVITADIPVAMRELLGEDRWSTRRLTASPSCFLLLAGSSAQYTKLAHHNIHFGRNWDAVFDQLINRGELMSDPSFLVSNPTRSHPELAPEGRDIYYVFFPTPNTTAHIDWRIERDRYRDHILSTLQARGYVGFSDSIEVEHIIDPADWQAMGMQDGSPFAAAHTFWQTGPFRPKNIWGDNVVFAGSSTTPGVGIPMVLISGRLAAERITGASSGGSPRG